MATVSPVVVQTSPKPVAVVAPMSTKKKVEEEAKPVKNGKDVMKPIVNITPMKEAVEKEQKRTTKEKKAATPVKDSPKPAPKKRATRGKASTKEDKENEPKIISPAKGRSMAKFGVIIRRDPRIDFTSFVFYTD